MTDRVTTADLTFIDERFCMHWAECIEGRPHFIYLLPEAADVLGEVLVFFSSRPWLPTDVGLLCQGNEEPLNDRLRRGEDPCGFRYPLAWLQLRPNSPYGRSVLTQIGYQWMTREDATAPDSQPGYPPTGQSA